jgi:K+-transporting ATPase ATPase A chain
VLVAVIRGFARRSTSGLGNFWVDLYRSIVYILAPIAVVFAVFLMWQGVPQTLSGHATAKTLEGAMQIIARGPVATQEAIKMIGTNGGGFYNSNSAVPFENPTGLTNFVELIAILLIPVAEVFMFGKMVFNRRHGWAVFAAMFVMFIVGVGIMVPAEQHGSSVLRNSGVNLVAGHGQSGGNMQDKEVRFGTATSALWVDAATATGNGSVNSGVEAFTPFAGGVALANIFAGEVIFGGVGSGLYGMFFAIIIAVFVAGLMVGRTPEYLGKKIEAREIKLAALGALFLPTVDLSLTAIAVATKSNLKAIYDPGAHGFTEALYGWTSQTFNNGSAFAGYTVNNFLGEAGAAAMLVGRYVPIAAALAIGGSLAAKKTHPASAGTFRTDGPTFVILVVGVIALTAGLMLLPALFLGPIVEGLSH